ncbi:MAG: diguanylate cyclase [Chloroflexi bacterium]|nr:diguanylate cyclase [Chloroflexota bacterium]
MPIPHDQQNDSAAPPLGAEQTLRQRAEEKLRATRGDNLDALSLDQARQLLHELQVHQIELEMQNEELRRVQGALESARARYFDLYDLAPVGYITLNPQGLILQANLRTTILLGVSRGDLVKQPLSHFIVPEDQDEYYLRRRHLFTIGTPQVYEVRMKHNTTGDVFWARLEMTRGQDSETQAQVCRTTLSDISEQKLVHAALRENEERFRTIVESVSHIAVQGYAPDGTVTLWNPASEKLYGYSAAEALGKHLVDLIIPPEMQIAMRQAIAQMMTTGIGIPGSELLLMRKDGSRVAVFSNHTVTEVRGRGKELYRIDIDLTERKQLENALHAANLLLENQLGELQNLHIQVLEQSIRDPLTHLYNRRYLNETLPREIVLAFRHNYAIGILILDIDHFKTINDTYGHLAGDETLVAIARALTTHLRASDIVCRYGGEEFLCLLMNTTQEFVLHRAEQLRAAIADLLIVPVHPTARVTASIGVALLPTHGDDMIAILKSADEALYQAKTAGRNCVRLAQAG